MQTHVHVLWIYFNVLDNSANIGRFLLSISMMMTFPMECYVSKHCLLSMLQFNDTQSNDENEDVMEYKVNESIERGIKPNSSLDASTIVTSNSYPSTCPPPIPVVDYDSKTVPALKPPTLPFHTSMGSNNTTNKKTKQVKDDDMEEVYLNSFRDSMPHSVEKKESPSYYCCDWVETYRIMVTVVLWSSVVVIAVLFSHVGIVLSLTGKY